MENYKLLAKVKELYSRGGNIIQFLKKENGRDNNTIEDILISYDFQAGNYTRDYYNDSDFKKKFVTALAASINKLLAPESILEIGVGEATTLGPLLNALGTTPARILGLDISWSRLKFAKALLNDFNYKSATVFSANLFEVPLPDNSVDVVYTADSLEPNGGKEEAALKELYRICKKYLVLVEPAYELANEQAQKRMKQHGYVTNLYGTAQKLGYKIIEYRLFDIFENPLNPEGIMIIEKDGNKNEAQAIQQFMCPITKTPLKQYSDSLLYSEESGLAYPVIRGIPCLLKENAILATHLLTDYENFKKSLSAINGK